MASAPPATTRRDAVIALGVVVGVLLLQAPFRLRGVNLLDEGTLLQIADDLRQGRRLYSDAVVYAFPGVFYLTAAVFALFGPSLGAARMLACGLFALATGLVYVISRWWYGRAGALGVAALFVAYRVWAYPHWHIVGYATVAVVCALAATWLAGEALDRRGVGRFVAAGAATAAAVLAKQDSGGATAAALALWVCIVRPSVGRVRALGALAAGGAAVLALAAAGIVLAGMGPDLVREAILGPLWGARHFAYLGRPALWPLFRQDASLRAHLFSYFPPVLYDLHWPAISESALYRNTAAIDVALKLMFHLPWMLVLAAAVVAFVRRDDGLAARRRTLVWCLATGFLLAFNRPHDWAHLLVLYPSTLLLAVALAAPWVRARRLAGGLVVVAAALVSGRLALEFRAHHATLVRSPRGLLYATAPQAHALTSAVDALAPAPPGTPLLSLPYHLLLNFLTARPPLTRFYLVWPVDPEVRRDEQIIARLAQAPATTVVYSTTQVPHFPPVADYAPTLFRHLVDHYEVAETFGGDPGGFTFLRLGRRTVSTGDVLGLDAARVGLEPETGSGRPATAAERAALVGTALWPFEEVLRVTTVPEATVVVAYRVTAGPGVRVDTAYGIDPQRWADFPPPRVRFALAVRSAAGAETALRAATVDPFHVATDRRWSPVTVDLSPWAGQEIEVVLRTSAPPGVGRQQDVAGWVMPRLRRALDARSVER